MTKEVVEAILVLAAAARARVDNATPGPWQRPVTVEAAPPLVYIWAESVNAAVARVFTQQDAVFVAAARSDVPALCDAVCQLADELLTAWAILSDATSESSMYAQGVRDSLAVVEALVTGVTYPPHGSVTTRHFTDAVRALLPE